MPPLPTPTAANSTTAVSTTVEYHDRRSTTPLNTTTTTTARHPRLFNDPIACRLPSQHRDDHIITASHVINPEGGRNTDFEDPNKEIIVTIFIVHANHPTRFEKCRLVFDDPVSDVAIIQVKEVAEEYNFCIFFGIITGMKVRSIADSDTLPFSFAMGCVSLPRLIHDDLLLEFRFTITDEIPLIQLHIHNFKGASGGLVFDSRGYIIGMISSGSRHNVYIVLFGKLKLNSFKNANRILLVCLSCAMCQNSGLEIADFTSEMHESDSSDSEGSPNSEDESGPSYLQNVSYSKVQRSKKDTSLEDECDLLGEGSKATVKGKNLSSMQTENPWTPHTLQQMWHGPRTVLCSYIMLPMYALVAQMGSHEKNPSLMNKHPRPLRSGTMQNAKFKNTISTLINSELTICVFLQGLYEGCEHPDRGYDAKPSTPTATRNRRPEPPPLMQPCRTINAHIHPEHPMSIGPLIRFDELKNSMNQSKVMAYFR
ncbi:hypothetical protein Vadar_010754 [Vaccinium darrowii]|uniref:Uncharacterized protein n=1 Tax=Vaccinium darrowii TaxID=229202 RepID=A0ACB7YUL0_9ERIC|nr:hypothetical protein Vadar_010754 [Vaccinium darrowii]